MKKYHFHMVMAMVIISWAGCGIRWVISQSTRLTSVHEFDGKTSWDVSSLNECVDRARQFGKGSQVDEWFSCKQILNDKITLIVVSKNK